MRWNVGRDLIVGAYDTRGEPLWEPNVTEDDGGEDPALDGAIETLEAEDAAVASATEALQRRTVPAGWRLVEEHGQVLVVQAPDGSLWSRGPAEGGGVWVRRQTDASAEKLVALLTHDCYPKD